ncbi:hypothetical protein DFQ29_010016, partial [Apophysomyces sp. BC1021]
MRPSSLSSQSSSASSSSSALSFTCTDDKSLSTSGGGSSAFFSKLAGTVRDTRSKVEAKKSELNATMQEKLPEWKSRSVMYGHMARDKGMEWGQRGKDAVDRWKKERAERELPSVSSLQKPSLGNPVFGMPLEIAVALTRLEPRDLVPAVFRRCIDYLDNYGINEVGIYRVSGSATTVSKMRAIFDAGSDVDFHVTHPDPHAVGTLLKMYLRELPEPIVPPEIAKDYSQQIIEAVKVPKYSHNDGKIAVDVAMPTTPSTTTNQMPLITPALLDTVRSITAQLPIHSFCLLHLLFQHLKRIVDHADENRMTTSNLALIFIPTLGVGRALFHCMVDHYYEIYETKKTSAGPASIPPPLPAKPHNIKLSKSMLKQAMNNNPESRNKQLKNTEQSTIIPDSDIMGMTAKPQQPPPKPIRSPIKPAAEFFRPKPTNSISGHHRQQSEHFSAGKHTNIIRESKPRSKSLSSPSATSPALDRAPWKRGGKDLSVEIACDSSAKRYIEQDDEALFILDSQDISPSFVASQFSTCPEVQESRIMVNRSIASILNPSDYKVDTAKDNRLVGTSQAPQPQLTVPDPEPRDLQERTIQHDISRFDLESQLYTQQYTPGTMAQPRETLMTDIESTLLPMWEMIRDQKPLEVAVFSRASRSAIQARYLRVLEIIYEAVSFNVMMTKREVFYKDVELFENQTVVDKIIDDICCHYNVPRFSLNIDIATRHMVKYLATQYPQTPILALVDNDPYGLDIYSVYKWGSQAQAFDQANLAVPQIQLLGLTHQDRKDFGISTLLCSALTSSDRTKAINILESSRAKLREYDMNQFSGDTQQFRQQM